MKIKNVNVSVEFIQTNAVRWYPVKNVFNIYSHAVSDGNGMYTWQLNGKQHNWAEIVVRDYVCVPYLDYIKVTKKIGKIL